MPEAPSLAVIIPAYNAERFLERAVESVFATGYPGIEVVVVDDGSADGTLAVAQALEKDWGSKCRVLRHPDGGRHGVSASRNLGIEASTSEWLAFLDADDEFLPNRFDDFLARLKVDASFDGIYGTSAICIESGGVTPTPTAAEIFGITKPLIGMELLRALLEGVTWQFGAITLRRALVNRVGNFDSTKRIAEDCHLAFKVASAGTIVPGVLDRPISRYWRHGANTYAYRIEHRFALQIAMCDAEKWCRENKLSQATLDAYDWAILQYASNTIDAASSSGRFSLALRAFGKIFAHKPWRTLSHPKIPRQIFSMFRRSIARKMFNKRIA